MCAPCLVYRYTRGAYDVAFCMMSLTFSMHPSGKL